MVRRIQKLLKTILQRMNVSTTRNPLIVGEAIEAFRELLKDCLNKASTLEATKACGDIE